MRKGVYIVVLGLAFAVLVLSASRSEPSYRGKSLSDWIIEMNTARQARDRVQAHAIVHRLGTNSIPLLLEWLQRPDKPSLKSRFWQLKSGTIGWLEGHKLIEPRPRMSEMDWKESYRALAQRAFEELGPDAKPAVPVLIQWLGRKAADTNELDVTAGAAYCVLSKLAPASIEPLIGALSSTDDQVWALAAGALGEIGPDARAAVLALRPRLHDPHPLTRVTAANMMGKVGGDPQEFMPVLIQTLREPDFDMLSYKLEVLIRYRDHAKDAVPVLLERVRAVPDSDNLTNRIMRDELTSAIRQIDPAAVPNP